MAQKSSFVSCLVVAIFVLTSGSIHAQSELRKTFDTRAIRLGVISNHYRTEWEWSEELMPTAQARLERWLATSSKGEGDPGDGALDDVRAALDDDLDIPGAIEAIDRAVADGADVTLAARLLGIDLLAWTRTLLLDGEHLIGLAARDVVDGAPCALLGIADGAPHLVGFGDGR